MALMPLGHVPMLRTSSRAGSHVEAPALVPTIM
jgi:hypothetical protein